MLQSLHWVPIEARIQYKVTLMTFKALHDDAPWPPCFRSTVHPGSLDLVNKIYSQFQGIGQNNTVLDV